METNNNQKTHKSFWPLVIVGVVAFFAGGLIFLFTFNNMVQDDLDSINFFSHRQSEAQNHTATKTPASKLPAAK